MPNIDLSILNQRQTPAFYADVFANRPAAGFVGRIFISTNTFAFYRDNGTSWDLIGGPGTGTVTGTGANGQVTFWNGASTITGSNDLFWDATNGHLGVNTNAPGTALDVHHDQNTVAILNQTVATNDTRIGFQNNGVGLWRIGNFYNLGSNDYAVNDAVLNINRFTIKSSSGQTFVGDETTSSGLFVVNNSSGDAHIVALGATAPSIRVRNAGVGASLQFGLGLATTTNNFIQGSTGGEFCIFNDSLTAQPILFGIKDAGLGNTQEAARISPARNFLIGTTTDAGQKLQVSGTALITGAASFSSTLTTSNVIQTNVAGGLAYRAYYGSGNNLPLDINIDSSNGDASLTFNTTYNAGWKYFLNNFAARISNAGSLKFQVAPVGTAGNAISWVDALTFNNTTGAATFSNNVGIGLNSGLWDNTILPLEVGNRGGYYAGFNSAAVSVIYIGNNSYYNGGWKIANTSIYRPTQLDMGDGNFNFLNASSGTAGSAITWNNRMQVNSIGNVLIGTTTDNGNKLQVNGAVQTTNLVPSCNLAYTQVGYTNFPNVDNAGFTLQSVFPNVSFNNAFISLRLQLVSTDGGTVTSTIINCVRNNSTSWNYTIVNSISVGASFTPVLTFGGTSANPTLQITGATFNSCVMEITLR